MPIGNRPKIIVIDMGLALRYYLKQIDIILAGNYLLQNSPPPAPFNYSFIIEESVRQIVEVLTDDPNIFFNVIKSLPKLINIFGPRLKEFNPDTKIQLEDVWKKLAVTTYMNINDQLNGQKDIFNYILLNVLDDGLVFAEGPVYV